MKSKTVRFKIKADFNLSQNKKMQMLEKRVIKILSKVSPKVGWGVYWEEWKSSPIFNVILIAEIPLTKKTIEAIRRKTEAELKKIDSMGKRKNGFEH